MADTPYPIPREARQSAILSGDGLNATYGPFSWKIFDTVDVSVWTRALGDTDFFPTTVAVSKVSNLPQDYFTVTFVGVLPETTDFIVVGDRLHERSSGITRGHQLDPAALEKELSKQGTVLQEHARELGRAVRVGFGETPTDLPASDGKSLIGWNGGELVNRELEADLLAAAALAADAARQIWEDFLSAASPLFAVKLNSVTADGNLDYPLSSRVPGINGHLHVNGYVGGVKQPKDGAAYLIVDDGATFRLSEYPGDDVSLYVESAAGFAMPANATMPFVFDNEAAFEGATIPSTYGYIDVAGEATASDGGGKRWRRLADAPLPVQPWHKQVDSKWFELGEPNGLSVSIKAFGARLSPSQTPAQRRQKIQIALDWGAQKGVWIDIPAGVWIVDGDLFYRDGSRVRGAGKTISTVILSDDADVECCVFRPEDLDVRTTNVKMMDLTGDANADRPTVMANPVNRPAGTAFLIAHTTGFTGENLQGKNAVLHGIDIAPGGDLDGDGIRQYKHPGGVGVYSGKRSEFVLLQNCEGCLAGDDAITTHHCGPGIVLINSYVHTAKKKFQTAASPNGLEIDDGSSDVGIFGVYGHDVNRLLAIKCHATEAAARRVRAFGVDAWRCTQAVFLGDDNATTIDDTPNFSVDIVVDGVHYREPLRADPANTNSLSAVQVRAFTGATVKGVRVDGADAVEALGNAIIFTDGARACTVSDYTIRNWASGLTPVVQIGTNSIGNSLLNGRLVNCQAEVGVSVLGSNSHIIDGLYGDGSAVANSVLLSRSSSNPFTNGIAMNVVGSGYTSLRSQGGTTATRHRNVMLGDVTNDGYLHAGSFTNSDFHRLYADKAEGSEMLRIDDQAVSLMRAYTTGREFYNVNVAAHVLGINMNNTTSRSINANGTINASGADVAEYHEVKPHLYGSVAKGAILGFAADGLLTDRFADVAGRFVMKSTSPNLVGGDTWGEAGRICEQYGLEPVGEMPELSLPDMEGDEPTEQDRQLVADLRAEHAANVDAYHDRKSAFDEALEAERAKWDRIAKSGYVPVNIAASSADIGRYLVPVDDGGGGITATLVDMGAAEDAATTIAALKAVQKAYRRSIGVVIGVADDGRALVEVKVG